MKFTDFVVGITKLSCIALVFTGSAWGFWSIISIGGSPTPEQEQRFISYRQEKKEQFDKEMQHILCDSSEEKQAQEQINKRFALELYMDQGGEL
jgi:hypothetical protein